MEPELSMYMYISTEKKWSYGTAANGVTSKGGENPQISCDRRGETTRKFIFKGHQAGLDFRM